MYMIVGLVVFREGAGEVVVYQWIEWLREWLSEKAHSINSESELACGSIL